MAESLLHFTDCPLQQADLWQEAGCGALSRMLGFAVPDAAGHVTERDGIRVARLSPRRFWIIGAPPLQALAPEEGVILPLDQGRVTLVLTAQQAESVLPQLMAIDWEAPYAAPGRLILSAIHRVPVAVLPHAGGSCEVIVPRSFAESIAGLIAERQAV